MHSGVENPAALSPLVDAVAKTERLHVLETELSEKYGDQEQNVMTLLLRVTKSLRIHNTGLLVT